jgi:hypothetical protein
MVNLLIYLSVKPLNFKNMNNFEKETRDFIETLPVEVREELVSIIEWEKELSWSNGYADAVEELESASDN